MTKIILFNGPPRSGKDTATDFAKKHLGADGIRYRFAAPLKDATHALFGFKVTREHFDDCKDVANPSFMGMSPREAYIWISEEVAKPKFGKDFFAKVAVNAIKKRADEKAEPVVIISDCGFIEEVNAIIDGFGVDNVALVHLKRPNTDFTSDSRSYINGVECKKYLIHNNSGLADLKDNVIATLKDFTDAK